MEYPKAFNCLTRIQFHSKQGRSNDLDERVQGKFLKGSFLGSKMDCFFGDGVGGLPCSREAEILGWQSYIYDLTAWAMQASLEFGSEIEHACRWPDPLHWNNLTVHRGREAGDL